LWRDRWRGLIPEFDDFVAWLLQNAGLIVAGRFHAVCLALDLEIPVLAVPSNTWKIESLLAEVGLKDRIITDLDDLRTKLAAGGPELLAYSSEEIESIRNFRKSAKKKALEMFVAIRQASEQGWEQDG
jgi:polysaccharide pyruvyl transferase WcaK-like protein